MLFKDDNMKKEIKNLKTSTFIKDCHLIIKHYKGIVWSVEKKSESKNLRVQRQKKNGKLINVQRAIVKSQNLSKSRKLVD